MSATVNLGYFALKNFLKQPFSLATLKISSRVCSFMSLLIENAFEAVETATFASFASLERVIIFTSENRKFFGAQFIESKCVLCYYNSKHFGGLSI